MLRGIDVSYYQGSAQNPPIQINWQQVVSSGVRFAIVRGGDGTFRDPDLERNVGQSLSAGIAKAEPYHFLRFALHPEQMTGEILRTHERAVREGMPARNCCWLDHEDTSAFNQTLTPEWREDWLARVIDLLTIPNDDYSADWWWWANMPHSTPLLSGRRMWTANYPFGISPPPLDFPEPSDLPIPWGGRRPEDYLIWQHSSSGSVPGISGRVDLDIAQDSYLEDPVSEIQIGEWVDMAITVPRGSTAAFAVIPRSAPGHIYAHPTIQDQEGIGFARFLTFDVSVEGLRIAWVEMEQATDQDFHVRLAFQRVR